MTLAYLFIPYQASGDQQPVVANSLDIVKTIGYSGTIVDYPSAQAHFIGELSALRAWQAQQAVLAQQAAEAAQAAQAAADLAAQQQATRVVYASYKPSPAPPGDCNSWMTQAGITDQADASFIIMHESGCNPNSVNASSGACGIGQQNPCGKWPHAWNDPVGGMIDMQNYVVGRYGSWANAAAYWRAHSNY